ncbi:hypothetical protein MIMGU_mgv1a007830mg [Erythranthe guttata]|uniref:Armadillo-like repeats domain-containing protein n=1 Tax=Erythranthe guttata TaxID=4155 RepID=A0A022QRM9_ERYGU|nr:PREDICTED: uncharacterized protein LOC105966178 [Erythranthe guttata]EYU30244.1 hypothetical protein MIMGU_mgv1a007830mg [Erythranthe guttata]|eukprot:XP_012846197.1 PREDICTED: uncharacterized protein LOC105966178 [Erythranthe guttata]
MRNCLFVGVPFLCLYRPGRSFCPDPKAAVAAAAAELILQTHSNFQFQLQKSPPTMATSTGSLYATCCSCYTSKNVDNYLFPKHRRNYISQFSSPLSFSLSSSSPSRPILARALPNSDKSSNISTKKEQLAAEEEEEVEEDLPWIQEKALDLVEFTGSVSQAIPGPRVGRSSLPWVLAVPLAYLGVTFVIAFVKTVRKFGSPREKRRQLINKNVVICKSIDELFEKGMNEVDQSDLKGLMQKTGFDTEEILRKYIRYVLNEKPFDPDLISNLIQLRKKLMLDDSQVAVILYEISRRIVKDKGPVVMDMSGYSETGFKRKLAVQALFGKVYYLSELPEFGSKDSSLTVKEIFGVADEDAEKLRLHAVSEAGDLDSLEKMIDGTDAPESSDESSRSS